MQAVCSAALKMLHWIFCSESLKKIVLNVFAVMGIGVALTIVGLGGDSLSCTMIKGQKGDGGNIDKGFNKKIKIDADYSSH